MKSISLLIKPSSGSCNLNCSYCFYKDLEKTGDVANKGEMSENTMKNLIDNVFVDLDKGDMIKFDFQGGEPTLRGIDFYKNFVNYVKSINKSNISIEYGFQTNGILLNDDWCNLFNENKFLVGLSIDGLRDINDKYRIDYKGKGTYEKIMNAKETLDKNFVEYNILTVLTDELAKKPELIWGFIKDNNIRYIQFIPCLDNINNKSRSEYVLSPENFTYFYKHIFHLWRDSLYNDEYYSIGLIDELINLLGSHPAVSCATKGICSPQYVVEADGTVYPCDFYVLEKYNLGNINKDNIKKIFYNKNMKKFLDDKIHTPDYCRKCKYYSICNGGCKRLKKSVYLNNDETSCGYKSFLDSCVLDMLNIVNIFG